VHRAANLFFKVRKEIDALGEEDSGNDCGAAAATGASIDVGDETNPMAVAPPVDGWSGFTEVVGDETNPTAAAVAAIDVSDETNPMAAEREGEPPCEPMGTAIPTEAGPPTEAALESRLQAESAISRRDETKPSPARSRSATASDHEGPRDEADADPGSPNPAEKGPTPPGGAEPSGPDRSPPLPAIVLKVLARRRAEVMASLPLDVRPPRTAQGLSTDERQFVETGRPARSGVRYPG
jgi:hypothetical protein